MAVMKTIPGGDCCAIHQPWAWLPAAVDGGLRSPASTANMISCHQTRSVLVMTSVLRTVPMTLS